jgi:PAS domain S-box-containing protein
MFMLDLEGHLLSWNAGVERLLGWSEEEWLGQHARMIFTPAEKAMEVCESEMSKAIENGSATDIRWHRRKDGTEFFANGFMNVVRDEAGAVIGFVKILSDETARKQLQDSLSESNAARVCLRGEPRFARTSVLCLIRPASTKNITANWIAKRTSF